MKDQSCIFVVSLEPKEIYLYQSTITICSSISVYSIYQLSYLQYIPNNFIFSLKFCYSEIFSGVINHLYIECAMFFNITLEQLFCFELNRFSLEGILTLFYMGIQKKKKIRWNHSLSRIIRMFTLNYLSLM